MGVQLQTSDIVACHQLPSRKDERVKPVIVSLINNAVKRDVMMGRRNLKGTRIYVNEQLTKKNAALFKKARELKKNKQRSTARGWKGLPKEVAIWVAQRDTIRRGSYFLVPSFPEEHRRYKSDNSDNMRNYKWTHAFCSFIILLFNVS